MRSAFIDELTAAAEHDARIVFVTGDLGYSVFEKFAERHPKKFYNLGIMEQSMMSIGAGLALCGKKAIVYSIATFATMRPYEQIRLDVAFQRANVIIVGVGAGLAYGAYGPTHHATEDVALMRSLPGMVVLCPGDPVEARLATRAALAYDGPVYLRIGKGKEKTVHAVPPAHLVIGEAIMMREGTGVTIIATGDALGTAAQAVDLLVREGVDPCFISMPCVKPLDEDAVLRAARATGHIITVEEHNIIGGLGSAVAETLASTSTGATLTRIGVPDTFIYTAGSQEYQRAVSGITPQKIVDAAKRGR
jgi:transketolase